MNKRTQDKLILMTGAKCTSTSWAWTTGCCLTAKTHHRVVRKRGWHHWFWVGCFQGSEGSLKCQFNSAQFSSSVVSDSLWPHELQHARPPCPSPTPGVHSNSRPSSQWCHPAISSSIVPFSSCPISLPASESFPMSQLFAWGGQSVDFANFLTLDS